MNSRDHYDLDERATKEDNHSYYHNKNHSKPGKSLLKSTAGSFGPATFTLTAAAPIQVVNQTIAAVTIDTARLCNPIILVDFAGILTKVSNAANVANLHFTLFRTCKDTDTSQPLATFVFSHQTFFTNLQESEALKFEYSSCDDLCDDCCTYELQLTSIQMLTPPRTISITVNGILSVLAVASK